MLSRSHLEITAHVRVCVESHSRALSLLLTLGVEVRVDSRVEGIDGGERRAHSRQHKGRNGGREIPMHPELQSALVALRAARGEKVRPDLPVVYSERGRGYSAAAIAVWFHTRFAELRIEGASSHSGRRTFIASAAKKIVEVGGSLRDVQELAGHTSLATTQRYIQGDSAAKRNVIKLI